MYRPVVARTVLIALTALTVACSTDSLDAPLETPTSQAVATTSEVASTTSGVTTTSAAEPSVPSLAAEAAIVGDDVVINVTATGFEIRYVEGDVSGGTAHVHAYVDRSPPASGDNVPLGDPSIVHSTSSTITVRGLESGVHQIWVIAADGNDDALIPPEPVELTVTVP